MQSNNDMRNSKITTNQVNQTLIEAILIVRSEVSFETVNLLDEAIDLANKVKAQGSFSCRALKTLSENLSLACGLSKRSGSLLLNSY